MNKKTIQWAFIAAITGTSAINAMEAEISPIIQRNEVPGCPVQTTVMRNAPRRAETGTAQLTVSVILDNTRGQEIQNVLAISADPERPVMYDVAKTDRKSVV